MQSKKITSYLQHLVDALIYRTLHLSQFSTVEQWRMPMLRSQLLTLVQSINSKHTSTSFCLTLPHFTTPKLNLKHSDINSLTLLTPLVLNGISSNLLVNNSKSTLLLACLSQCSTPAYLHICAQEQLY